MAPAPESVPAAPLPFVSVVMPVRNEARYIARSLAAVLGQDYPRERLEVLLVDGLSGDETRRIASEFAARDNRLTVLDNPAQIVPTALNRAIRAAHGEIIIRVDGHAVIAPDYIRRCVQALAEVDAECAGGAWRTVGETWVARGIALAQSSPFGVGDARFRTGGAAQFVDTVPFGAYRRRVFERIGLFDEELVRNQDDEFNLRLTRSGGKIWMDPAIRCDYYARGTLRGLWKQYFEYGLWKARVIRKHGRPAALRHLVPALFVLALVNSVIASLWLQSPVPCLVLVALYAGASLLATAAASARRGWTLAPMLPPAYAAMHFGYGIGFLAGVLRFWLRDRPAIVLERP